MRDFSYLRGTLTHSKLTKHNPREDTACTTCGDAWRLHRHEPTDTACTTCTCETFVQDTSGPPDEVQEFTQWHYADSGEVITDPDEIAELERRLAAKLGGNNGRTSGTRGN